MERVRANWLWWAAVAVCSGCGATGRGAYAEADAQYERARSLYLAGDHVAAGQALGAFADRFRYHQNADTAQYWSGEAYYAAGHHEAAFDAYQKLSRHFKRSKFLARANRRCFQIGSKLLEVGDAKGIEVLDYAIDQGRFADLAVKAHMDLGTYYWGRGRFAEAQIEYDAVARDHAGSGSAPLARFMAALSLYRQVDEPARNMEKLAAARKRLRGLRTAALPAGLMEQLDRYLGRADDLGAERHLLTARFYLKQGVFLPAIPHLKEVLEKYPESGDYEPIARDLIEFLRAENRKEYK